MSHQEEVLFKTREFVQQELRADSSGHDWWHIDRVTRLAKRIAKEERADEYVCELAALLHDVADEKLNPSKEEGLQKVRNWLQVCGVTSGMQEHVMDIITNMSYSGGHNGPMRTLEGRVVQDADRLDALGAIGIARTFVYSGWKGRPMHLPDMPPRERMTREEYRNQPGTSINHFYEKLLKLKDMMNTGCGKNLAEERQRYMEEFLRQFYKEWDGE